MQKLYIGFGDTTVLGMIDHLRLKTAIKMTTAQKHKYRTTEYNNPWDLTTSITAYFTQLDRFQLSLGDPGIATSGGATDVGRAPEVLHRQVAGMQTMFRDDGETIAIQGGSASCPRDSSSKGRRRVTGNVICDATGATRQTDCSDGSNKQGQHGCNDGTDECDGSRKRR
jgi:hypothetical protein